jgi:hypothetical protein
MMLLSEALEVFRAFAEGYLAVTRESSDPRLVAQAELFSDAVESLRSYVMTMQGVSVDLRRIAGCFELIRQGEDAEEQMAEAIPLLERVAARFASQ